MTLPPLTAAMEAVAKAGCVWRQQETGSEWFSACGTNEFRLDHPDPGDMGQMKFCCFCGRPFRLEEA
jgi:hypothetical protein